MSSQQLRATGFLLHVQKRYEAGHNHIKNAHKDLLVELFKEIRRGFRMNIHCFLSR